jgi:hypothetical protein
MTDTGNAGQGQESSQQGQQQGQEPAANAGQQQQGQGQESGQQQQTPSLDGITDPVLRSYVEKQIADAAQARQEAARYRTERNGLESKVTEYQRANETAEQRAQREAEEHQQRLASLEAENRALKLGGQWTTAASAAKALDPVALLNLIGGADKIEMGEDGKATNLEALLNAARQQYPWAFSRTAGADAGDGGQGAGPSKGGMNDFIRGGGRRG